VDKRDFRILVADDDEIARDVLGSLLSKEGYSVLTARDGLEAIGILRRNELGLIITDLRMPGADGIEVLRQAIRINPDMAVVILTAYGSLDSALEAMEEGAYDYLTKPFKVQEILIITARAYRRALLLEERRELIRLLRDTYRDLEVIKNISMSNNVDVQLSWLERIERLKTMDVLTDEEVDILKERLLKGNG
jgi:DNA-binding NtrC family response regulator